MDGYTLFGCMSVTFYAIRNVLMGARGCLLPTMFIYTLGLSLAHAWSTHFGQQLIAEEVILINDNIYITAAWQPCPGDRPMYEGADMPATDLPEDHLGPEPQMAPVDISRLTKVTGYEGLKHHSLGELTMQ